MKTITFIFTFCIASAFSLSGWGQSAYQQGDLMINAGLGLGSMLYGGASLNATAEYFINDQFSLGGGVGYTGYNYGYSSYYNSSYRLNVFYIGPRGSFHFAEAMGITHEPLDIYAGAFVGVAIVSASYRGETIRSYVGGPGAFSYDIFGGARYQFSPNIAAYGELGLGISILQLGATFKL